MYEDAFLIVFIAMCTAFLSEGILYLFVYRTDSYKRLKATVEKQSKKLEKKKEQLGEVASKKLGRQEEQLKTNSRDLNTVKMKSAVAIGLTFTALMGMFNTIFDGRVVAKLPFEPFSLLQGLSHRTLMGSDFTDCSFIFLYILCTMAVREKMLGFGLSRTANKLGSGGFMSAPPSK
ncbi:calcium load-activated calcium channel-like isoform X2 [Halichondria panicea]|uniref:calcium load-activated calcium channel-like isoform X2 n=1 Tax=Halichondria panicea TaxID=6063 RepID=UPI00312B6FD6